LGAGGSEGSWLKDGDFSKLAVSVGVTTAVELYRSTLSDYLIRSKA
jgi:hypothetical protein